ncbi:DUF551 domain-containing protein [Salmonella enterica subsp. enterica serovar Newport]|nr:DUF551 domain-containing protein [Salmonella enterica subsp. enterica serovar Newport]EHG5856834.1 DUF551 domain-containing protein [Salmonella enterica subsp. enterica serovar Newport]
MTTITREQLHERARRKVKELEFAITQSAFTSIRDGLNEELELARIALASLDAKPIYQYQSGIYNDDNGETDWYWDDCDAGFYKQYAADRRRIVYTAAPVPVVPDYASFEEFWSSFEHPFAEDDELKSFAVEIWNACRTALLHGAEPVSQTYELPQTQFELVADLYEMQFDDGRTCAFHTDGAKAAQWLLACDGNKVQEYVRLERYHEAVIGNSPVIPDGWISCSERMPDKGQRVLVCVDFDSSTVTPLVKDAEYTGSTFRIGHNTINTTGETSVTHWMPLPAPPQQ